MLSAGVGYRPKSFNDDGLAVSVRMAAPCSYLARASGRVALNECPVLKNREALGVFHIQLFCPAADGAGLQLAVLELDDGWILAKALRQSLPLIHLPEDLLGPFPVT